MYRLTIWLIAIVFVFNGAASLAWIDLPAAPATIVDSHDDAAVAVRDGSHSHDVGGDVAAAAADHGQASGEVDNCLKCCGTCSVTSMVSNVTVAAVIFSGTAVKFRTGQRYLVGHLVALDPDIPKIIV